MFYLIIAALITSYYLFMAPKSVRNTLGMIGLVALLIVLAGLSFIKIMQTPKEIFVGLAMIVLGYYALRDIQKIPKKPKSKH